MKLGILANTDKNIEAVIEITRAALAKGHEVAIFTMDEGTRLLENPSYSGLCKLKGVNMSFCDYSAKTFGVRTEGLPQEIVCGSQYNNAEMNHNSDKVIVL